MKIESVSQKYFKVTLQAMFFILLLSALLLLYFISDIKNRQTQLSKKDLATSIHTLQRDISERFSVFVSSQIFIDYLRSGQVSREKLELDLNLLASSLKSEEVEGIDVDNNSTGRIYSYGARTSDFIKLRLCYLDNVLNYNFGQCVGHVTLFFSMSKVLQHLTLMNPQIERCSTCRIAFFSNTGQFGSFKTYKQSKSYLRIEQRSSNLKFIYVIAFSAFILAMVVFFALHQSLRRVSQDYIYSPIKRLVSNLEMGKKISLEDINVHEIKYVAQKLNDYIKYIEERETLNTNARIGELATRVAHDIKSPVSLLEILLESNTNLPETEKHMLSLAAKRITDIANDLLKQRQNSNMSLSLLVTIKELIAEKKLEYSTKTELNFKLISNISEKLSIHANASNFKSILSNLINNSIEACYTKKSMCDINISVSRDEQFATIIIHDNGIGIPLVVLKNLFVSEISFGKKNGNGIGLFNAKKMLTEMGGDIDIESIKGTKVTVRIPCFD